MKIANTAEHPLITHQKLKECLSLATIPELALVDELAPEYRWEFLDKFSKANPCYAEIISGIYKELVAKIERQKASEEYASYVSQLGFDLEEMQLSPGFREYYRQAKAEGQI